ncbi:MAG: hypothetical protein LBT97_04615 [Planctomycetota bacterium]|nr:hypothetical protein [Planctomycetota bacterium]
MTILSMTMLLKKRILRRVLAFCLILILAALAALLVVAWSIPGSADDLPWSPLPGRAFFAVDVNGTEAVIARLLEDRALDSIEEIIARDAVSDQYRQPLSILTEYLKINTVLRNIVQPRRICAVFLDDLPPVVFVALPKTAAVFVTLIGKFSNTVTISDDEEWNFTMQDGWLVASVSKQSLTAALAGWSGSSRNADRKPRPDRHYVAFVRHRPGEAAMGREGTALLEADPFAAPMNGDPGGAGTEKEVSAWALAVPKAGGWDIRGGSHSGESALPLIPEFPSLETGFPELVEFGSAPPHGHVRIFLDVDPELRWIMDRLQRQPETHREPPWKTLGKFWLKYGWLAHADGGFSLTIAADPRSWLPALRLGWGVRGQNGKPFEDFKTMFGLWIHALTAPGGQPIAQALRSALEYVEYSDEEGGGGMLGAPGGLLGGAGMEWRLSRSRRGCAGEMFFAHGNAELGADETPAFLAWRTKSDEGADLSLAADWRMTEALRKNSIQFWRLLALAGLPGNERPQINAWRERFRPLIERYPLGSLSVNRQKEGAILFRAAIRTR